MYHIVSDVEYIANEILIMKNGELIHQGAPDEILKPIEKYVWECEVSRKEAEKERQKREAILAKQKVLAEKAAKEDRKAEKKPKKKSGGHRGFWSFLGFHKKKK